MISRWASGVLVFSLGVAACGGDPSPAAGPASTAPPAKPAPTPTPTSSASAPASAAPTTAPPAAASGPLASVAFLQGTWSGTKPDGTLVEEKWSAPEGSVMKGESRSTQAGKVTSSEVMSIEVRPDAIVLVATPSGQKPAEFPRNAKSSTDSVALFMNLEHEWPTRIRYERVGDDLKVKVQGRPGQQVEEFTLKRSPP